VRPPPPLRLLLALFYGKNDNGLSTRFYGQFTPAYLGVDDGQETFSEAVDNNHSNSRVGIDIKQAFDRNVLRFNFETALGLRQSNAVSQTTRPDAISFDARDVIRFVDVSLKTNTLGTVYAGQGSMATDHVAQLTFSGTALVAYNAIGETAGAFRFRATEGVLSDNTIGAAFPSFDGPRLGRVRYDTPSFHGFHGQVAAGYDILNDDSDRTSFDAALVYARDFDGLQVKGAVGYANNRFAGGAPRSNGIGSLTMLFDSGFNFEIAGGTQSGDGDYGYGKVGYLAQWWAVGSTALAIDYYQGTDTTSSGSRSTSYGFGVVQTFKDVRIEAYVGLRGYELDETAVDYQDMSSIFAGARWKF